MAPPTPNKYFARIYDITKVGNNSFTIGGIFGGGYTLYDDLNSGAGDSAALLGDVSNDTFHLASASSTQPFTTTFVGTTVNGQSVVAQASGKYYLYTNNSYQTNDPIATTSTPFAVCFVAGTSILASRGDISVEDLRIGDIVITASGAERAIKWIGTRSYAGRFANANPGLLPICFRAGSLADGVPARDLWVSPRHAMFLDGCLIPAERLVNGVTITQAERVETVTYFHVELDSHDVLLAEGAPSESFVDDEGRNIFHNAHEFAELYPDARPVEAVYCAPRVEDGYVLQAVRTRLALRAGLISPAANPVGDLRGNVDGCDGVAVWGWAQSLGHPDAPVCLEVLVDGASVGLVYADAFRGDLAAAGIGDGHHAFRMTLREPASPGASVAVRRAVDGAILQGADRIARDDEAA